VAGVLRNAAESFAAEVVSGSFPTPEYSYR
jgi:hypothetical protein